MRRRISLYIADRKVDLDDDNLVLLNYTMEDLTNPTDVKNSYSQQITLKGTANNNAIFGDYFRLDRLTGDNGGDSGADFNALRKTPFTIYNELNEVLESGYVKLDSVKRGVIPEYKISLFGGLGSFIYSLSYDQEGNRRTLADLDYLGTASPDTELTFVINKTNVASAWATQQTGSINSIWKVLNFAPAYNGIPDGNFSADKAVVDPADIGLDDDVDGHTTKDGYCLVNLSKAMTEWDVKDLRSYLQRPVLSMRAFLEALQRPSNTGGHNVSMPFLDKPEFANYAKLWLTLPLLPSLGTYKQTSGDLTLDLTNDPTSSKEVARYTIDGDIPSGTRLTANLNVKFQLLVSGLTANSLSNYVYDTQGRTTYGKQSVFFIQAVAHAEDDFIVGGSRVKALFQWNLSPKEMAARLGYVPQFSNGDQTFEVNAITEHSFQTVGEGLYQFAKELGFTVEAEDVAYYTIHVTAYDITTTRTMNTSGRYSYAITSVSGGTSCLARMYSNFSTGYMPASGKIVQGNAANTITYTSSEFLRSGATITKQMLLSSSRTPAEYLLSFCKMFGLHILYDKATRDVTIVDRNDLFVDEVVDLTGRIDLSQDIDIVPYVFNAKWYDFQLKGAGGAFYEEYRTVQGIDYGIQRVNTGYDFNADVNNLLADNAYKSGATILDRSQYYTVINKGAQMVPSVFIDAGTTYTLWDSEGNSLDVPVSMPPYSVVISYFNSGRPGYDIELARKMEFRSKDNKPVDGTDVLLWWTGAYAYAYFKISDDNAAMDALNDGVPCWDMTPGSASGVLVPDFQRYIINDSNEIVASLDFGVPKELDIPGVTYREDATLYAKFWKNYLADRFHVDSEVMTCRVNFGGMQVGYDLLRKFYWYDNSLWVLNRISNYSLTTYDPVECEFIRVQDKDNYLNGQY